MKTQVATPEIPLKEVVAAYVASGNRWGFAYAEGLISHFTPPHVIEGKCFDVPVKDRPRFMKALENPVAFLKRSRKYRRTVATPISLRRK